MTGSLVELADRIQLGRAPLARSWRRARGLPMSAWSMTIAHIGVGVFVAGVTASSAWQQEAIVTMAPGETVPLAGYDFTLARIDERQGPNFVAQTATIDVTTSGGAQVATLQPEKRFYPVERQPTSEAGIDSGILRDLYVVLGDEVGTGNQTVRIYVNPLVLWIWGGVMLMGSAGLLSLADRRLRVGAPTPAKARLRAAPASA
jgi:cytochrome c-type biogenesis protein CcmF